MMARQPRMLADTVSKCPRCGEYVHLGDEIGWDDEAQDWCHVQCLAADHEQEDEHGDDVA